MTLLDAPQYDPARAQRNLLIVQCSVGAIVLLFVSWWLVAGRPVDWPWNWNRYLFGRATVNKFLTAVEANDLPGAYGIWINDKNWQQHPDQQHRLSLRALPGRLEPHQPRQRIRRHQEPQDRGGRALRQQPAGGRAHQRPQDRCARSLLRTQDRPTQLRAARREPVPGAVNSRLLPRLLAARTGTFPCPILSVAAAIERVGTAQTPTVPSRPL